MDNVSYLNGIIQRMSELRENEFVENNFSFQEKELVKKIVNENTLDFKNFQIKLRKKASLDKMILTLLKMIFLIMDKLKIMTKKNWIYPHLIKIKN